MRKMMLARRVAVAGLLIVSVSGCWGGISLQGALDCSSIIGPTLREDVEDVPPPDDNSIGGWVAVADARSQGIEDANGRKNTAIENVDWCHAQQERLTRKRFLGLF